MSSRAPNVAAAAVVVVGVAVQVDVVADVLSRFFALALLLLVGAGAAVWLVREAWEAVEDWRVMGPPDLGPWRRKREEVRDR